MPWLHVLYNSNSQGTYVLANDNDGLYCFRLGEVAILRYRGNEEIEKFKGSKNFIIREQKMNLQGYGKTIQIKIPV